MGQLLFVSKGTMPLEGTGEATISKGCIHDDQSREERGGVQLHLMCFWGGDSRDGLKFRSNLSRLKYVRVKRQMI